MKSCNYRNNKAAQLPGLLFCIALFLLPSLLTAQHNGKNHKKDLENKTRKINDEISEINTILKETKANKKISLAVLVNINVKLEKRQDLIKAINAQIREITREIRSNEQQVEQLKNHLIKLKAEYARMIVFAQRNQDAYTSLMFIFSSESFNQAYARLKYIQQYTEFRKKQALEILNTQSEILAKLNELKEQRHQKNLLLGNEEEEKTILNSEKQEQEQLLTELQTKEKELKSELEKKKRDAANLQLAIKKLIEAEIRRKAEEAARAAEERAIAARKAKEARERDEKNRKGKTVADKKEPAVPIRSEKNEHNDEEAEASEILSADFANNRGKLPWPVTKGMICETYGEHEHPAIKGFMMFNNGVEMCVNKGVQVRAVFEGEVTGIAVSPTGGKLVIVKHGGYFSVYSNIGDVLVKTGQKVSVKQPIGTVMYNEEEGKASINFQIWKDQKTLDPAGWLYNAR